MNIHDRYLLLFLACFVATTMLAQDIPFPTFEEEETNLDLDSIRMSVDFEDVVVTAQYAPTDSKSALHNIRTINRAQIEQQGATNLEQLLLQDLNVRIQQDLITGSNMRLLGVGGENVKIMLDGVPIIGRLDGNIDLGQINLNTIERVEIIEGPMSVNFGTDAIGGIINLISKKSQLEPFTLQLSQQIESRGENQSLLNTGIRLRENVLFRLSTGFDKFSGYSNDTLRNITWNPKRQAYTNASIRHDFKEDHSIRYQFDFLDEEIQDLGNVQRSRFKPYAFDNFYLTRRSNHALVHEGSLGEHFYWKNTLAYNDFDRKVHNYRIDFDENKQTFQASESDTTTFQLRMLRSVLASKFKDSPFNFQLGLDLNQEYASGQRIHDASSSTPDQSHISDYAAFGTVRYQPSLALMMEVGLRASQNSRYNTPFVPSFRLKYRLNEHLDFRASYGKGFRSPSLKELFLNFIDTNHFILGYENLKTQVPEIGWDLGAETSDNIQLNLSYRKQKGDKTWSGQVQSFYNTIDNQIELFAYRIDNEQVIADVNATEFTYFNIAQKRIIGSNLRLQYQWSTWQLGAGLSNVGYSVNYKSNNSAFEDFVFATEWNARLTYRHPMTKTQAALFVRGNDRFINYYPNSENGLATVGQQLQDGFTMLDASLTQTLWHKRITLTGGVRNILDVQQVNLSGGGGSVNSPHGGGDALNIGVGRSFFVRAAYHFGAKSYEKPVQSALRVHSLENELYKTWIDKTSTGASRLQYARWKGKKWSKPKTISPANNRWIVNEIDAPQLLRYPNSETLATAWMQSSSRFNPYDQDIFIAQSDNEVKTWSAASVPYPHERLVSAFYGNIRLLPLSDTKMLALWLDGRNTKYEHKTNGRMLPKPGSKYELRSIELTQTGKYANSAVVTDQIVGLCPFDLVQTEERILAIYRNERNDISISNYQNGTWSTAQTLSNENWRLPNTIEAPAAAAQGEKVAIAWYSNPRNKARISLAFSDDNGSSFLAPFRIDEGKPVGKVDVIWQTKETAIVAWVEEREADAQIVLARYDFYGKLLDKQYLDIPLNKGAAPIQLSKIADKVLLTYRPSKDSDYLSVWLQF